MTIGRHMREVLELHLGLRGGTAERRITELLEETELPAAVAARYPHELSGGQKQRAAIAIALSLSLIHIYQGEREHHDKDIRRTVQKPLLAEKLQTLGFARRIPRLRLHVVGVDRLHQTAPDTP